VENATPDYRLIIFEHRLDPHIFRDILADKLSLHLTDAMRLVSHAPGVIPFAVSRADGRRVGAKLASVGVSVGVWPVSELPDLSGPRIVHKLEFRPDGFETFGLRGEPYHWVPWELVELLSVGEFPHEGREHALTGPTWLSPSVGAVRAVVLGYRRSGTQARKQSESSMPELWIVRRRPVQAIRVQQDRMNYECLADQREPSTRANFRRLIEAVIERSLQATTTPATRSYLAYDRPGEHFFSSAQDFMEYTTWQLLLRWRDRPPDAEPNGSHTNY
jgi:hypothetical protein